MNTINRSLQAVGKFFLHYIDFFIFIILITLKLHLFADITGTVFDQQGIIGYFGEFFNWIFTGSPESLTELRQGIVMVSVGAILLASFWVLVLPRRSRLISFLVLDFVLSFIIFADTVYFRYFEDLISMNVMLQAGQVGDVGESIFNLFAWIDWLYFIDVIIFLPLVIFLFRKIQVRKANKKKYMLRITTAIAVFIIGYTLVFYPMKVFIDKGGSYLFEKTLSNMRVYEKTGLLGFHGFDIYKYVNENVLNNNPLSKERKEDIHAWFKEHQEKSEEPTEFTGMAEGLNVIILQLEAFENNLIGKEIDGQEITPNLNDLKEKSLYFDRFYHQTSAGRTSDAEFLANASFYPMYTGAAYMSYSGNTFTALPQTLKDQGYTTTAFHAYKKSFWNRYVMYPTLGIDKFYSLEFYDETESLGWSISDKSMLNQSVDEMATLEEPFYSQLITLTSHHPYDISEKHKDLEIDSLKNTTYKNYLQSAHYVDQAVGQFIERLKEEGLWEKSLLVVHGDHDSALLQKEGEIADFVGINGDPLGYQQEKKEVPLFIHLPNNAKAGEYDLIGGQIDLGPTILDLLGVNPNDRYMMGQSIFRGDNTVIFRTGSFTTDELFYIASIDGVFENGVCYDVESREQVNLSQCRPEYEKVIKQLQISDDTLQSDLIDEWINEK